MTTSSPAETSLQDLIDELRNVELPALVTTGSDTITLSNYTGSYSSSSPSTYTIGAGITNCGTISISSICPSNYNYTDTFNTSSMFSWGEEWTDKFPDWQRVKEMCEEYPGLKIAYEKFKTVYKLVKDDYDTTKDKR